MEASQSTPVLLIGTGNGSSWPLVPFLVDHGYTCLLAADAIEAASVLASTPAALAMIDVRTAGPPSLTLVAELQETHPDTAVLVVGPPDVRVAEKALDAGADGYLTDPLDPEQVLIQVRSSFRHKQTELQSAQTLARLDALVQERTAALWQAVTEMERTAHELHAADESWVDHMLRAARFKDDETAAHIQRMSRYCELLASVALDDADQAQTIRLASQLHDIGKVAIPDEILLKMGPLTDDEKTTMQQHTLIGRNILGDERSEMAHLAAMIALTHHERWDGMGYPLCLAGEAIPVEGRIAAIADAFDALTTNRIYRRAFPLPDAIRKMRKSRGQFDPGLLEPFLGQMDEVLDIQQRHPDATRLDT